MNGAPTWTQLAGRLMTLEVGDILDVEDQVSAIIFLHAKFLNSVSSLVGVLGGVGLFRRSLKLTQGPFPWYAEALRDEQNGLVNAVGTSLRTQTPDAVLEGSIALLSAHLELLSSFIGVRLTRQLVQETWPELRLTPSAEEQT